MIIPNVPKKISYLTISDIHLLHPQNETQYIADSLFHYFDGFSDKCRFTDMDIIFIAGDIFDSYVDSKNPEIAIVQRWMRLLMGFCLKHGIKLRVLEGTPGHDYKQSRLFDAIAAAFSEDLDYKYIQNLDIEIMRDLGITVLYVPDEWKQSAAKAQIDVQEKLDLLGLEKVDIACMHGMFDFQIPEVGDHPLKHNSEWYHDKVRYYINIGHDHKFKTFDRIIVQGSFDRIAHGEEGKKGGVVCHLDPTLGLSFEFIENKRARIFKTITIKTKDLDKGIEQVKTVLNTLPNKSHVRISTTPDNPILSVIDEFRRAYPDMRIKKHRDKKQIAEQSSSKLQETISINESYVSVSITPENIVSLILDELKNEITDNRDLDLLTNELKALTI